MVYAGDSSDPRGMVTERRGGHGETHGLSVPLAGRGISGAWLVLAGLANGIFARFLHYVAGTSRGGGESYCNDYKKKTRVQREEV